MLSVVLLSYWSRTQFSTSSLPSTFLRTEFTTSSRQTSLSLFLPSSKDYLDTVTRHCRFRPSVAHGLPSHVAPSLLRSYKTTRSRDLTSGFSWRSWYLKCVWCLCFPSRNRVKLCFRTWTRQCVHCLRLFLKKSECVLWANICKISRINKPPFLFLRVFYFVFVNSSVS